MATTKKSSSRKRTSSGSGPKSKRIVRNKMQKTMHEFKHHELSRGKGGKVKNRKQAIAIGLSEARRAGANVPSNPSSKKKTATKKKSAGARKTATKKASSSSRRKSGATKATSKKSTAKRSTASKKR